MNIIKIDVRMSILGINNFQHPLKENKESKVHGNNNIVFPKIKNLELNLIRYNCSVIYCIRKLYSLTKSN